MSSTKKVPCQLLWISEREMNERIREQDMPNHGRPTFYCCLSGGRLQIHPPVDPKRMHLWVTVYE